MLLYRQICHLWHPGPGSIFPIACGRYGLKRILARCRKGNDLFVCGLPGQISRRLPFDPLHDAGLEQPDEWAHKASRLEHGRLPLFHRMTLIPQERLYFLSVVPIQIIRVRFRREERPIREIQAHRNEQLVYQVPCPDLAALRLASCDKAFLPGNLTRSEKVLGSGDQCICYVEIVGPITLAEETDTRAAFVVDACNARMRLAVPPILTALHRSG